MKRSYDPGRICCTCKYAVKSLDGASLECSLREYKVIRLLSGQGSRNTADGMTLEVIEEQFYECPTVFSLSWCQGWEAITEGLQSAMCGGN